jgi:hypothetical protein
MCPNPEDVKRGRYLHMETAMRSITDSCQFLEHGGMLNRDIFLGTRTPKDELDHARKMARTFQTFIDDDDPSRIFHVCENGGDAELTHYEQFVLVQSRMTQDELKQFVAMLDALADEKLSSFDKPCDFHQQHGAIQDCKDCKIGCVVLKELAERIENSCAARGRYNRGGCF